MNEKPIIGIAGFGIEGRALYEHFKDRADIHIFDEKAQDARGIVATFHTGFSIPAEVSVLYKSPGIPTRKILRASESTHITTLMDLFLEMIGDRAVGVTGTKGKSTVASLINHILLAAGRDAVLLGNIGTADLRALDEDGPDRIYVFELSSYQCEHIRHSPHIAVLTNFFQEHLSHHGSLDAYQKAKLNIARFQHAGDIFVNGTNIKTDFKGMIVRPLHAGHFDTKLIGEHNQMNCALALAAVAALGVSEPEARQHIATFEPLPYRLEKVGEFGGIIFYDDSLATVPEATMASLAALPRVDTLILGGEDRGIDFAPFAGELSKAAVATYIVFPDTGPQMVAQVKGSAVVPVSSMEEAVKAAFAHTPKGGTVLLSNASPSFNLFKNYQDKSAQYREWVKRLTPQ
jgi:UDP-N-acetylmuramoylalanine--D-glutamate ligase